MYFDGNFRQLGTWDSSPLNERLREIGPAIWEQNVSRQLNPANERHKQTKSILMIYDEDLERLHSPPTIHPAWEQFKDLVQPVLDKIAAYYGGHGYFLRAVMPKLAAGKVIAGHVDRAMSLINAHRVHMPVITSSKAVLRVGGETRSLELGQLVEINNQRTHAARNDGEEGRVHLLVDWVETDASGAPLRKKKLDIVLVPDSFDETCEQIRVGISRLDVSPTQRDGMLDAVATMSREWRRTHAEHADNVSGRAAYKAILEPLTSDLFLALKKTPHTETPDADAFGRLFSGYYILENGLYEQ